LSLPGLTRSRACPTSALINDRNRKHPISIGNPVSTAGGYWIARSSRAMTAEWVFLTSHGNFSFAPAMQVLRIRHVLRAHDFEPLAGVDFSKLPTIIEPLNGY
jgi:hypothetical protein